MGPGRCPNPRAMVPIRPSLPHGGLTTFDVDATPTSWLRINVSMHLPVIRIYLFLMMFSLRPLTRLRKNVSGNVVSLDRIDEYTYHHTSAYSIIRSAHSTTYHHTFAHHHTSAYIHTYPNISSHIIAHLYTYIIIIHPHTSAYSIIHPHTSIHIRAYHHTSTLIRTSSHVDTQHHASGDIQTYHHTPAHIRIRSIHIITHPEISSHIIIHPSISSHIITHPRMASCIRR